MPSKIKELVNKLLTGIINLKSKQIIIEEEIWKIIKEEKLDISSNSLVFAEELTNKVD